MRTIPSLNVISLLPILRTNLIQNRVESLRAINQIYFSSCVRTRRKIRSLKVTKKRGVKRGISKTTKLLHIRVSKNFLRKSTKDWKVCFYSILLIEQNGACPATRGAKSLEYCPLSLRNKSRYKYFIPISLKSHPSWKRGHLIRRWIIEINSLSFHPLLVPFVRPLFLIERSTRHCDTRAILSGTV